MHSLEELQKRVGTAFSATSFPSQPENLYDPIRYTLEMGGKRLRPLLVMLGCDLFGGDPDRANGPAIGIELFHNFTLLHDDIMDEAMVRRGKPTVHRKWNPNVAILSGDTLFSLAYRHIARAEGSVLPEVLRIFTDTAIRVCEGQQYDMDFEKRDDVTLVEYLEMIRLKTAVLLGCSLRIGALTAGAPAEDARKLGASGEHLGMAFQLQDDLLDAFGDEKKFGKEIGGDILACKKTFLYLKAIERLPESGKTDLVKIYSVHSSDPKEKIRLVRSLFEEASIPMEADRLIKAYTDRAETELEKIDVPDNRKDTLRQFMKRLLDRDH